MNATSNLLQTAAAIHRCGYCRKFFISGQPALDPQPVFVPEPHSHGACAPCAKNVLLSLEILKPAA